MALDAVAGQPRAAQLLSRALESGRVAHAYAFIGPPDGGRTAAALAFAAALLCSKGGCAACRDCRLAAALQRPDRLARQHPDLHVIVPTPPENNPKGPLMIRIDDIRELERKSALRPVMAARKVFVIDDAERMKLPESPAAFLKTLEEPPASTVMILTLATTRILPPTVLSRCQPVRFQPKPDTAAAESVEAALALLAEVKSGGAEVLLRRTQRIDRDRAGMLVDGFWRLTRDFLLVSSDVPAAALTVPERAEEIAREAAGFNMDELLAAIDLCRQAREGLMTRNVSPGLTMEVVLSRLALRAA